MSYPYLGIVHDFLWTRAAFISKEGRIEFVSMPRERFLQRGFYSTTGWEQGLRLVNGMICKSRSGSDFLVAYLINDQNGKGKHLYLDIPGMTEAVLRDIPNGEIIHGTSNRPRLDHFGREGIKSSFWPDCEVWTATGPNFTYKAARITGSHKLEVETFSFLDSKRSQVSATSHTRLYKGPGLRNGFDLKDNWELVDIHPTLGNHVLLRRGSDWCVLKIPSGRAQTLTVEDFWVSAERPFQWTRFGNMLGFRYEKGDHIPLFQFWTGEDLTPSKE